MSIDRWPLSEQPRQKFFQRGAMALSDAELLALFIRCGTPRQSAVEIARNLLSKFHGLRGLLRLTPKQFCAQHGLGKVAYIGLHAALELAARYAASPLSEQPVFTDPQAVRHYLQMRYAEFHQQEIFSCLLLDCRQQLIRFETVFYGSVNRLQIYPRECARLALQYNASGVILAHNHPATGSTTPSNADIEATQSILYALKAIDVSLHDHIIVGHNRCASFSELGLL